MAGKKRFAFLKPLFNVGKKFVDISDDIWNTMRGVLSPNLVQSLTPLILGSVGFITHLGEGWQAAKMAWRVAQNKHKPQRRTRLFTLGTSALLAGSGFGVGITLLAYVLGAPISAATLAFAPALVPGLLLGIYAMSLWRKSYILHRLRKQEAAARRHLDTSHERAPGERPELLRRYNACRRKRRHAERLVAFNVVEVLASVTVLIGTVLATAAIIGASFGTFGALPLALLLAGVIVGVTCKFMEYLNKKNKFKSTNRLRNWIVERGKPAKKKHQQEETLEPVDMYAKMVEVEMANVADWKQSKSITPLAVSAVTETPAPHHAHIAPHQSPKSKEEDDDHKDSTDASSHGLR